MINKTIMAAFAATTFIAPHSAYAQRSEHLPNCHSGGHGVLPNSLMGTHMHRASEWMTSYKFGFMKMQGTQSGDSKVSDVDLVTTKANRFAGMAGQPPTLRVAPQRMAMNMHMVSGMYGVTDWLTIMAMGSHVSKEMSALTYAGGMGSTPLGEFSTRSSGFGDVKLVPLIRIYDNGHDHVHIQTGLSLPTGSITKRGTMLSPMNMHMDMRLGYGMQLGTGTYDWLPGVTYTAKEGEWNWGLQYQGDIRIENDNDEGYAWGDKHAAHSWVGYKVNEWLGTSARLSAWTQDSIDGIDNQIMGPMQMSDPDNYGGDVIEAGVGLKLLSLEEFKNHKMDLEFALPLYQDLNGVQVGRDWHFTFAWKATF